MRIVVFAPDLGDRSRIDAALGPVERVRSVDVLAGAAAGADVLIVDLERPGVADLIGELVSAAGRVIGFGPHVDDEELAAAAAMGVEAMPRSRFFADVQAVVAS